MGNCLVTKLKGVVDNENLPTLNSLRVSVHIDSDFPEARPYIFINSNVSIVPTVRIIGDYTFADTGTKVQNTTGNFDLFFIPLNQPVNANGIYQWNAPLVIEFDIVESTATNGEALVQVYSQTTNNQCTQWIEKGFSIDQGF